MGDLEKLLALRREIDRELVERHSREQAVMFTDIVGSTQYYETHGDIEGLALVRRHNELLFPLVEAHGGHVIKTVGDAIMAAFDDPPQAVRCAVEMQRQLATANAAVEAESDAIHIRIGVHTGRVMVDSGDLFGDTVNTAARVAHAAEGDEVLVSQALFDRLPDSEGLAAVQRDPLSLKGKAEPLAVVAVLWRRDAGAALAAPGACTDNEIFVLELGLGSDGLRVSAIDGAADKGTVKPFAEVPLAAAQLDSMGRSFDPFLRGDGTVAYTEQIRECGEALYQQCMSDRARRRLEETDLGYLRLHVDDRLVHLPWELMHDGLNYSGLRFAVGRMVSARAESSPAELGGDGTSARQALVVSNPSGDLPAAAREGEAVAGLLQEGFGGEVRHLEGPVARGDFLAALDGCRLLHFAGHARRGTTQVPGGLQLSDGVVSAADLSEGLGRSAPGLVFANSCHSSTGSGWTEEARGVYSLASSLLVRGTRHYLAPMWEIPDDHALAFSLRFYEQVLAGIPYGEAVRQARRSLEAPASFSGYVLYGDPRGILFTGAQPRPAQRKRSGDFPPLRVDGAATAQAQSDSSRGGRGRMLPLAVAGVLLALLVVAASWRFSSTPPVPPVPAPPALAEKPEVVQPTRPLADPPTGPIRLSILSFKNLTGDAALDFLEGGIAETLVTDFGQREQIRLIERGQIEIDIGEIEFSQSKYVDPATRAAIGKIAGAEVVVLGGFQRAGGKVRASARFVQVETGEILEALRVERPQGKLFDLQDALAADIGAAVPRITARLRP